MTIDFHALAKLRRKWFCRLLIPGFIIGFFWTQAQYESTVEQLIFTAVLGLVATCLLSICSFPICLWVFSRGRRKPPSASNKP